MSSFAADQHLLRDPVAALERQGLLPLLADPEQWRPADDGVLRLPWRLRRQASPQHLNPPPCS